MSVLRSDRYLTPRKTRYMAAGLSFTVTIILGYKILRACKAHGFLVLQE